MLRVIFICRCASVQTEAQNSLLQKDIWKRCIEKDIGGFLVRTPLALSGVFEGNDKAVIGQIERLIRTRKVLGICVLKEEAAYKREWTAWHSEFQLLDDAVQSSSSKVAGLAKALKDAVNNGSRLN